MTVLCKPGAGLTIDANAIYVLNVKSQGSTTWSDLPGSPQFPDVTRTHPRLNTELPGV